MSGRAVFLDLLSQGKIPEARLAALFGLNKASGSGPTKSQLEKDYTAPRHEPVVAQPASQPPPAPNMAFWVVSHYQRNQAASEDQPVVQPLDAEFFSGGSPFTRPAAPLWRGGQLRPQLMTTARCLLPGRRIDTAALVRHLSHARLPRRIPRRALYASRPGIWVVLDHRPQSGQFRHDVNRVMRMLIDSLGKPGENYRLLSVTRDTSGGNELEQPGYRWVAFNECPQDARILVVSPYLGTDPRGWEKLIQIGQQRGADLHWLNPTQPDAGHSNAQALSFTERANLGSNHPIGDLSAEQFLLACIAECWEVCPGLLRDLRHLLRLADAPVSIEMQVWRSPLVIANEVGLRLQPEYLTEYRQKFKQLPEDTYKAALKLITEWHRGWPAELRFWEKACWESQGLGQFGAAHCWAQLSDYTRTKTTDGNASTLAGWLLGAGQRHPTEFWQTAVGEQVGRAVRIAADHLSGAELPHGLEPWRGERKKPTVVGLYPNHLGVRFNPATQPRVPSLIELNSYPVYRNQHDHLRKLTDGEILTGSEQIRLQTGFESVHLRKISKPDWASAIEQGPNGLYCSLPDGRRVRWCYPGEPFDGVLHPLAAPAGTLRAAWVNDAQWRSCQTNSAPYLPEGTVVFEDQYGCYADLSVDSVAFRLRWVPPGAFWMGSPEDEPERLEREVRHRVVLTLGFWLAETACTQALWKAVMGSQPSRFQGAELPVESVSWEETQAFCEKLSGRLPGLTARLPSEAEWEYACRAGSQTVFWWGDGLNTEQANYDGNFPYAGGAAGEFREQTVAAKHFDANPWGLYQMHGNLYEWCQDWYGEYESGAEGIDPQGPERGSFRVFRGGGWFSFGRWLRAASRSNLQPDERLNYLGFRLAAGPRPGGASDE